ncbi:hypothetical protein [Sphingobium sp.]
MAFPDVPGVVVPSPLGAADDAPVINAALASGASVVLLPAMTINCGSTLNIPYGVELRGAAFNAILWPGGTTQFPTALRFAAGVATCITMGTGSDNIPMALTNIHVTRAGTSAPPAGSIGVSVYGGYNVRLENVMVSRHAIGYSFKENVPAGAGISAKVSGLYSSAISDVHLLVDSWPELYINGGRLGQNGTEDLTCNAYIRVTGGAGSGAQGPNSLIVEQVQFNQGNVNAKPAHWIQFSSLVNTGSNALEYKFTDCHIEGVGTSFITSNSATDSITQLNIASCTFNQPEVPFFGLHANTTLNNCSITSCDIFTSLFRLAPTNQVNDLAVSNCRITPGETQLLFTGSSTVSFSDMSFGSNVRVGGSGVVNFSNPTFTAGSFVFGDPAYPRANKMSIVNYGAETSSIGIAINGVTTGIAYSLQTASWQFNGNRVDIAFRIGITNKGSQVGPVALTNLPVPFDLSYGGQGAGGGVLTLWENMSGLTSPVILSTQLSSGGAATQAGLWMSSATGRTAVTTSNLNPSVANPTRLFGTLSYTF